jgi:hypothetical protein
MASDVRGYNRWDRWAKWKPGRGIAWFVFADCESSQISQGQEIPYNRKPCTILGNLGQSGITERTGAQFVSIENNAEIGPGIRHALAAAELYFAWSPDEPCGNALGHVRHARPRPYPASGVTYPVL